MGFLFGNKRLKQLVSNFKGVLMPKAEFNSASVLDRLFEKVQELSGGLWPIAAEYDRNADDYIIHLAKEAGTGLDAEQKKAALAEWINDNIADYTVKIHGVFESGEDVFAGFSATWEQMGSAILPKIIEGIADKRVFFYSHEVLYDSAFNIIRLGDSYFATFDNDTAQAAELTGCVPARSYQKQIFNAGDKPYLVCRTAPDSAKINEHSTFNRLALSVYDDTARRTFIGALSKTFSGTYNNDLGRAFAADVRKNIAKYVCRFFSDESESRDVKVPDYYDSVFVLNDYMFIFFEAPIANFGLIKNTAKSIGASLLNRAGAGSALAVFYSNGSIETAAARKSTMIQKLEETEQGKCCLLLPTRTDGSNYYGTPQDGVYKSIDGTVFFVGFESSIGYKYDGIKDGLFTLAPYFFNENYVYMLFGLQESKFEGKTAQEKFDALSTWFNENIGEYGFTPNYGLTTNGEIMAEVEIKSTIATGSDVTDFKNFLSIVKGGIESGDIVPYTKFSFEDYPDDMNTKADCVLQLSPYQTGTADERKAILSKWIEDENISESASVYGVHEQDGRVYAYLSATWENMQNAVSEKIEAGINDGILHLTNRPNADENNVRIDLRLYNDDGKSESDIQDALTRWIDNNIADYVKEKRLWGGRYVAIKTEARHLHEFVAEKIINGIDDREICPCFMFRQDLEYYTKNYVFNLPENGANAVYGWIETALEETRCHYKLSRSGNKVTISDLRPGEWDKEIPADFFVYPYYNGEAYRMADVLQRTYQTITQPPKKDYSGIFIADGMFSGCAGFVSIDGLTLAAAVSARQLFKGCDALKSVKNLSLPRAALIDEAFSGCIALSEAPELDFARITSANRLFEDCGNLPSEFPYAIDMTALIGTGNYHGMFEGSSVRKVKIKGADRYFTLPENWLFAGKYYYKYAAGEPAANEIYCGENGETRLGAAVIETLEAKIAAGETFSVSNGYIEFSFSDENGIQDGIVTDTSEYTVRIPADNDYDAIQKRVTENWGLHLAFMMNHKLSATETVEILPGYAHIPLAVESFDSANKIIAFEIYKETVYKPLLEVEFV